MEPVQNADQVSRGKTTGSQWRFGALLVIACLSVMGGQFWGLRQISALDGQQRTWNVGQVNRERELQDLERDIPKNKQTLEQTKAELNQAKTERDRLLAEEAKAKEELKQTRKAVAEAETALQAALQETRAAVVKKEAAETVGKREANLNTEVARLTALKEQLDESLKKGKEAAEKLTVDLTAERTRLMEAEKQVADARTQFNGLQAAMAEHTKTIRAQLAEVMATEQLVTAAKTAEKELRASNLLMATDKKEIERLKTERTQLAKTAKEEKDATATVVEDHTTAKQQLADTKKQVEEFQSKQKTQQAELTKSAADLIPALNMLDEVRRTQKTIKDDIATATQQLATVKKEIEAKAEELKDILKKIADAKESEKQSDGTKSEKPEAKESDKKSTDAKDADKSESTPADGKTSK